MSDSPFLTAEWRHLVMVNYAVDPAILLPFVPAGTELDFWKDKACITLVGFLFLRTRVLGLPIPFHTNFEEVNLRFYVRRRNADEWRRGVVFIKEIVPRFAIAAVARGLYYENYVALPMRHSILFAGDGISSAEYSWRLNGRWNSVALKGAAEWRPLSAGSEEEFITEHYWGYTSQRDGGCMEYKVEHPRWNVCSGAELTVDCDVRSLYGSRFESAFQSGPVSAFIADGSAVRVYRGHRIA